MLPLLRNTMPPLLLTAPSLPLPGPCRTRTNPGLWRGMFAVLAMLSRCTPAPRRLRIWPSVQYIGRFDFTSADAVRFDMPGCEIRVRIRIPQGLAERSSPMTISLGQQHLPSDHGA